MTADTISTANMTGLRQSVRGSSLRNASPTAGPRIAGSNSETGRACTAIVRLRLEQGAGPHRELLDNRAERDGGEIGQTADDGDHTDEQTDK